MSTSGGDEEQYLYVVLSPTDIEKFLKEAPDSQYVAIKTIINRKTTMGTPDLQGDDWDLPCSDDELSKTGITIGKNWMPDPNELEELYKNLDKSGTLPLDWKCPGRRPPSPVPVSKENQQSDIPQSPIQEEKSDFDFMDEVSSLRLRVRREGEDTLRGSAKKKTTSFDGILSNMIRHKRIEQMEKQASTPTSHAT